MPTGRAPGHTPYGRPPRRRTARGWVLCVLIALLMGHFGTSAAAGADGFANSWQLRASQSGSDGDAWTAVDPAVAYNSQRDEYLVVWTGPVGSTDEHEVYGRRADRNGRWLGTQFRLSSVGTDGDSFRDAAAPSVAYNSSTGQYLVVWSGDYQADGANEIYGQLVSGTGTEVGSDFRISDMGATDSSTLFDASVPDVAYNALNNEYLVVWMGDDNTGSLVDNEFETYGQRITAAGAETGTNDIRLSDMGPDGNTAFTAQFPAVAANDSDGRYLVTWTGDDNTSPLVDGEWEAWGQLVTSTGAESGTDLRLSDMGTNGSTAFTANRADVAYNSIDTEYLVVWEGDDNTSPLVDGENEIFVQKVTAAGVETGTNDRRISDMGTDGSTTWTARIPRVAFNPISSEYLVTWEGDDNTSGVADNQFEIWAQRLTSNAIEVGDNDRRISRAALTAATSPGAFAVALAPSTRAKKFFLGWQSDLVTGSLGDNEYEIFSSMFAVDPGIDLATSSNVAIRIDGAAAANELGWSMTNAGDVNGDGIDDILAGAPSYWNAGTNRAYVIWGGSVPRTVDLNALGTNGFMLSGLAVDSATGMSAARMGDLNGDGYDDIAIGAAKADNNSRTDSGSVYVVFGKNDTATVNLTSLGTGGYRIDGAAASNFTGWAIDSGDVDGNGVLDLVVSGNQADNNARTDSGSVYVVFGKSTTSNIDLASLGSAGWRIDGPTAGLKVGHQVSAGDVTGDGKADVMLGSDDGTNAADYNARTDSGSVWVVFGKSGTGNLDLASIGSAGYRIDGAVGGDELMSSAPVGDINGDGIGDLVVGAPWAWLADRNASVGAAYVLWGTTGTTNVDLASLGSKGYRIAGVAEPDGTGLTVAGLGDVDNDGTPDVYVGAQYADNNGRTESGSGYVVFGKNDTDEVDLSGLGTRGFRIDGAVAGDSVGSSDSGENAGGIGDQNADGRPDILLAGMLADPSARTAAGQAYVVSATVMLATATTNPASSVTSTGATFNGSYNTNGQSAYAYFEYGTSTAYGSSTSRQGPGSGTGSVSAGISGLSANTLYHYRLVVEDVDGFRSYGADQVFSTENGAPNAPTVTGGAANWQNIASQTIWATGGDDYAGTAAATGQIARYEFDAGSGTTVADRSGNGRTMSLAPAYSWTTDRFGNPNAAMAFDGSGGYASAPGLTTGGALSVAMWAKFDTLGTWVRLFDFGETNAAGALNNFTLSNGGAGSDDLRLVVEDWDAGGHYYDVYANNAIRVGEWQHYAATIDASGNMKLYVDGALVASATATPLQTGVRSNYYFGESNFAADDELDGAIDGIVITNNVLSASDVATIAGASGVKRRHHLELGGHRVVAHRDRRGRDAGPVPRGRQQRARLRVGPVHRHHGVDRAHRPHRARNPGSRRRQHDVVERQLGHGHRTARHRHGADGPEGHVLRRLPVPGRHAGPHAHRERRLQLEPRYTGSTAHRGPVRHPLGGRRHRSHHGDVHLPHRHRRRGPAVGERPAPVRQLEHDRHVAGDADQRVDAADRRADVSHRARVPRRVRELPGVAAVADPGVGRLRGDPQGAAVTAHLRVPAEHRRRDHLVPHVVEWRAGRDHPAGRDARAVPGHGRRRERLGLGSHHGHRKRDGPAGPHRPRHQHRKRAGEQRELRDARDRFGPPNGQRRPELRRLEHHGRHRRPLHHHRRLERIQRTPVGGHERDLPGNDQPDAGDHSGHGLPDQLRPLREPQRGERPGTRGGLGRIDPAHRPVRHHRAHHHVDGLDHGDARGDRDVHQHRAHVPEPRRHRQLRAGDRRRLGDAAGRPDRERRIAELAERAVGDRDRLRRHRCALGRRQLPVPHLDRRREHLGHGDCREQRRGERRGRDVGAVSRRRHRGQHRLVGAVVGHRRQHRSHRPHGTHRPHRRGRVAELAERRRHHVQRLRVERRRERPRLLRLPHQHGQRVHVEQRGDRRHLGRQRLGVGRRPERGRAVRGHRLGRQCGRPLAPVERLELRHVHGRPARRGELGNTHRAHLRGPRSPDPGPRRVRRRHRRGAVGTVRWRQHPHPGRGEEPVRHLGCARLRLERRVHRDEPGGRDRRIRECRRGLGAERGPVGQVLRGRVGLARHRGVIRRRRGRGRDERHR